MRLKRLLAISIMLMTAPAYASVDFSAYEPTLDQLYAVGASSSGSSYTMSFQPITKSGYDSSPATGKFISYENSGAVFSPVYHLYSYAPKYNFSTYIPILNTSGVNKYGHDINSVYSIDFSGSSSDYSFVIPKMINGVYTPDYYKITYSENASEAGNKASSRVSNTGVLASDIVKHFVGFSSTTNMGAIFNSTASAEIKNIVGDFVGNNLIATTTTVAGAAISNNSAKIGHIVGDFVGNYIKNTGNMSWGGALYSFFGSIDSVVGNFIGNHIEITTAHYGHGGALYLRSGGRIDSVTGNFIGNYVKSLGAAYGGALGNESDILKIKGDFLGNYAHSTGSLVSGGAIYNRAKLGKIDSNFIGNYSLSATNSASGGAVYNDNPAANIEYIRGDFIRNYAVSTTNIAQGGAVYNSNGVINEISGDFIDNYTRGAGKQYGGAIYNSGTTAKIDLLQGNFIGNSATYDGTITYNFAQGGAIFNNNTAKIGELKGNFINNYVSSINSPAHGGAIYNTGEITNLKGDFTSNYVSSSNKDVYGGAIYNKDGIIHSIDGHFMGNYVKNTVSASSAYGGAIYMDKGSIDFLSGSFINNYVQSLADAQGGAIYNSNGVINEISGDFIDNYIRGVGKQYGGAIYNSGATANIGLIQGNFIGNSATYDGTITYNFAQGGAIFNNTTAKIGELKGDFINNYVSSTNSPGYGGAIYNTGKITKVKGDFTSNYVSSPNKDVYGGAIYNKDGIIHSIDGHFIGNYVKNTVSASSAYGGAIYMDKGSIDLLSGSFINNYVQSLIYANGGAISIATADTLISTINADFKGNHVSASSSNAISGGAIFVSIGKIGSLNGDFTENYVLGNTFSHVYGGAIFLNNNSNSRIDSIKGDFIGNYASSATRFAYGGAIALETSSSIGYIDGSFRNNYAYAGVSSTGIGIGGAIYSNSMLKLQADGTHNDFTGNYVNNAGTKSYNAIFLNTAGSNTRAINLAVLNSGSITFNDEIRGANISGNNFTYNNTYDLNIVGGLDGLGEPTGEVGFNANVVNVKNVNVTNANLKLGSYTHGDASFNNNSGHGLFVPGSGVVPITNLNLNHSVLKMSYDTYQELKLNTITSTNNSSIVFGANFGAGTSDKIYASTANASQSINLRAINVTGSLSVGQQITLFSNTSTGYLDIGNIGSFRIVNDGYLYDLSYNHGVLTVANNLGFVYPIYVANGEGTLNFGNTTLDGASTEGVIVNDDIVVVANASFKNNSNNGNSHSATGNGGVILNGASGDLTIDASVFESNTSSANGGAVANLGGATLSITSSNFDGNTATVDGGAVYNTGALGVTDSTFESNTSSGNGGAIANLSGGTLSISNSSFDGNEAVGKGGAIYSADNMSITASSGYTSTFGNNEASGVANDIYMAGGKTLSLSAVDNGSISFAGGIDGDASGYAIEVGGNDTGNINFNSAVNNVSSLKVVGGSVNVANNDYLKDLDVDLTGGYLNYQNGTLGDISFKSLTSSGGLLGIELNPAGLSSDVLNISGDVVGKVNLVINAQNTSSPSDKILFAKTPNATSLRDDTFKVYRMVGSPFNWSTSFDDSAKDWYLGLASSGRSVASEIVPYIGLVSASFEQTRSLLGSIRSQTDTKMASVVDCRLAYNGSICDGGVARQAWVSPVYYGSHIGNPVSMDGTIGGLDAGFDLQRDLYNKLGVFASYRRGDYELNGHGRQYSSPVKSDLFIDSYLGGLYYRRDVNNYWLLSSVYGGMQRTEIKTRDGVRADSDAYQFGGNVEFGYSYYLEEDFSISPSLSVSYNHIDLGKMRDIYGKEARYGEVRQIEVESGVKFEQLFSGKDGLKNSVYVKPSLVQTFTAGDDVYITGLGKGNTYHDQLLGRFEIGGQVSLKEDLTAYGNVFYTGGHRYRATAINFGLTYKW